MSHASPARSWSTESADGLEYLRAAALTSLRPCVAHGFSSTRSGGPEPFDLGSCDDRDEVFLARRRRFLAAIGLGGIELAAPVQVHGATVARALEFRVERPPEADAVVALAEDRPRRALGVRSADCVPILLAASDGSAIAAVHAGWRGTAAGVAGRTVAALAALGVDPGTLRAALGPAVGPCCYEVSAEVVRSVAAAAGVAEGAISRRDPQTGGRRLDLHGANVRQLLRAGLPPETIETAPWCTRCTADRFFSHRRQGPRSGRMLACIGWAAAGEGGPPS